MKIKIKLIFFISTIFLIGCGKMKPNKVLQTTVEVNKAIEKDEGKPSEQIQTNDDSNAMGDSSNDIRIDLTELRNQIVEGNELTLDSPFDIGSGTDSNPSQGLQVDNNVNVEFDEDTLNSESDVSDALEGQPEDQEGNQEDDLELDEDSFNLDGIPDFTGYFDGYQLSVGDYFLYDDQLCIISSESTEIGPMPKVICVPSKEELQQDPPSANSPCYYNGKFYDDSVQWSVFETIKIRTPDLGSFGLAQYEYEIREITLECNNGQISSLNKFPTDYLGVN